MTDLEMTALVPFLALTGLGLLVLLVVAFTRRHGPPFWITLLGLAGVGATLPWAARRAPVTVGELLIVDRLGLLYIGMLLVATAAVALLSRSYWARRAVDPAEPDEADARSASGPGELYFLLVVSLLGGTVLVSARHLVSAFLGLETLSVGLYVLIAYLRSGRRSVEAGIKYLILAGASSAFLLFGMALLYAELGTMVLDEMVAVSPWSEAGMGSPVALGGLALVLVGVGFKLALVPFHLWTPDVYEGAPAPVTAFVATVSKGAVFGLLLRWSLAAGEAWGGPLLLVLGVVAAASMIAGNLLALFQDNVKRILAYSSIAHLGYALVALLAVAAAGAAGPSGAATASLGAEAVTFYLAAYFVTILGAFGVVAALSDGDGEAETLEDVRGLFWRRPWVAALFTAMLLSLAGIPLTGGFLAKFYAVASGVQGALWGLVLILVLTSAVGLFYYLRVVVALFAEAGSEAAEPARSLPSVAPAAGVALAVLAALLVWLGTWPEPFIRLVRGALAGVRSGAIGPL